MKNEKIVKFMSLAGQEVAERFTARSEAERKLGAQLLLSEVLEYVIHGLGVIPEVNGVRITKPDEVLYHAEEAPDQEEMLDGLSDVAYTMYWNQAAFGLPLEHAFELVSDNNLEKFVQLGAWAKGKTELPKDEWHCNCDVAWPAEVARVQVVQYGSELFAVGKDARGKVRKPSTYKPVDLGGLLADE
jgi:hypothetical protein